ncbi:hypothetical protein L208DRAFT_1415097 [Tricholoma matsutake]|nr:hypothetical protein L208DRAFT_1415097 [Tricholoma matsutake 945]
MTECNPGPSPLAQPPYDNDGHQHTHLTPHDDDKGPVFDGMDENGSGRGTMGRMERRQCSCIWREGFYFHLI